MSTVFYSCYTIFYSYHKAWVIQVLCTLVKICCCPLSPIVYILIQVLICIFLMLKDDAHFLCANFPSIYFIWWNVSACLLIGFNWIVYIFTVEFWEFFLNSRYYFFVGYVVCKYFLPVCLVFVPLLKPFMKSKFRFQWSPLCLILLLIIMFWMSSQITLHLAIGPEDFLLGFLKAL